MMPSGQGGLGVLLNLRFLRYMNMVVVLVRIVWTKDTLYDAQSKMSALSSHQGQSNSRGDRRRIDSCRDCQRTWHRSQPAPRSDNRGSDIIQTG